MFYTIPEVAKKWKLNERDFFNYCVLNHTSKLLSNPDISSSGTNTFLLESGLAYTIVSEFLTKDVDLPTSDELHQLQKDAIEAMATYFAKLNVTSSFDFNQDMRLENEPDFPAADFMCDPSCLGDFLSDMENDIYTRTAEIQKEFAETIKR